MGISVAHELPQELADIHMLVNKAGLHWSTATIFNVFSGSGVIMGVLTKQQPVHFYYQEAVFSLSGVIMGACLTYFVDIGSELQGALLALGAGVFLFVGMTQLGTSMLEVEEETDDKEKETKNPCRHMKLGGVLE